MITGHRNEKDQNEAFEEGKSEKFWPNSKHNERPSMAIDAAPYFLSIPHIKWKDEDGFRMFAGYVMGVAAALYEAGEISHVVRWGGDWDRDRDQSDQAFMDLVHFELVTP